MCPEYVQEVAKTKSHKAEMQLTAQDIISDTDDEFTEMNARKRERKNAPRKEEQQPQ